MNDGVYICTCSLYKSDKTPKFFIYANSEEDAIGAANRYAYIYYADYMPHSARVLKCLSQGSQT